MLHHVVETSRLAAVIAAELGADVQIAKIGGLLHDIGKAVDHEVEGPHAAIGAQIAQRHDLPFKVVNAHRRAPPGGRVRLPRGADRPGRRRDQRLPAGRPRRDDGDLRQAPRGPPGASPRASPGVERSFAVQAGREVRILVRPEEIDDLTATRLARDIVKKIEEQLTYPGQIKVTVIRETRAVEYAK